MRKIRALKDTDTRTTEFKNDPESDTPYIGKKLVLDGVPGTFT